MTTMKRNISSSFTIGAALAVLVAAAPAWSANKQPGGIELDGWFRPLRQLPTNDIPVIPKKKPYMHTVQEDSIEDFEFFRDLVVPDIVLPPINELVIADDPWRTPLGLTDWNSPGVTIDFNQPELLPFSPDLGTVPVIPYRESEAVPDVYSEDYLLLPDAGWSSVPIVPDPSPVPAPGALALLSLGLGSMLAGRRRR